MVFRKIDAVALARVSKMRDGGGLRWGRGRGRGRELRLKQGQLA